MVAILELLEQPYSEQLIAVGSQRELCRRVAREDVSMEIETILNCSNTFNSPRSSEEHQSRIQCLHATAEVYHRLAF